MKYSIIIPTYNAGANWESILKGIIDQYTTPEKIIVIDSQSVDQTVEVSKKYGCLVIPLKKENFNHGGTRQFALSFAGKVDVAVFLTQDASVADNQTMKNILEVFSNNDVGAVYGKQLSNATATLFEQHEREFTYTKKSEIYNYDDRTNYGIKTCFLSNAFTAYRLEALNEVGGFPDNTIVSEDMCVGAKILKAGWKLAYCAEAAVVHSHSYNLRELFGRYFDIGVFNARESWIQEEFGTAESEGMKYVKSEMAFLLKRAPWLIPYALVRTVVKFLGFKVGLREKYLPKFFKKTVSRQKNYWSN